MATLTSLGFNIFSTYDGNGLRRARADLNDVNSTIDRTSGGLNSFTGRMSAAVQAAALFGPALVPIAQGLTAVAGGLAAVGVTAGAALGVYGAAVYGAITRTQQMVAANEKLSASQKLFVTGQKEMIGAWQEFITATQDKTLTATTVAMGGMVNVIRSLKPVVDALHPAIMRTVEAFRSWTERGDGLQRFIDIVIKHGVPAMDNLLMAGREVITFLGIGFRSMVPLIIPITTALREGATALREWAQGGGFDRFMQAVRENSGPIKEFFRALWDAFRNILATLRELGPFALGLTTTLLKLVAAIDPEILADIVKAIFALRAAMFAWAIATTAVAIAHGILALIMSPFLILIAGAALTILAIVAAVVALGVGIFFLVKHWDTVWNAIKTTAQTVWTFLTQGLGQLVLLILGPVGALLILLNNWTTVWNAIKNVATIIWTALQVAWDAVVNAFVVAWQAVSAALVAAWNAVWNAIMTAGQFIWTAITTAWNAVCTAFTTVWQAVSGALVAAWNAVWNAIMTAGQAIWTVITTAWNAVCTAFTTVWQAVSSALSAAWNAVWTFIKEAAMAVWATLEMLWKSFLSIVQAVWSAFSSAMSTAWRAFWDAIKTAAEAVWNFLKGAWQTFVNAIRAAYNAFSAALQSSWRLLWDFIKTVAEAVWNFLRGAWQTFVNAIRTIYNAFSSALQSSWRLLWDFIKTVAEAVWNFLKGAWETFVNAIRTIYNTFSRALQDSWELLWNTLRDVASRIWETIKDVISDAINAILTPINMLIKGFNAIGNVFGLPDIPEISVNFAFGGIVGAPTGFSLGGMMNLRNGGSISGYAPGKDRVPAMLSPGEGVLVPEAVRGLGGAGFIREANNHFSHGRTGRGGPTFSGGFEPYAKGGVVGGGMQHFAVGGITASALARAGVGLGMVTQGEFSNGSLSAGTHMGGGAVDIASSSPAVLARLISAGFAAWIRGPAQGFSPHIHAVLIGHPQLSGPAAAQVQSFLAGGTGLGVGGGAGGGFSLLDMFGDIGELILKIVELTPIEEVLGSLFGGDSAGGLFGTGIGPDFGPDVVGAVGDVADAVTGGAFSSAGNAMLQMMYGLITMADLDKGFSKREGAIDGAGTGSTWFGEAMTGAGKWLLDKAKEFIFDKKPEAPDMSAMAGGAGGGVAQWAALAATAIQMGGLAANQLSAFLALMQAESGGNPFAINRTDSNALAGIPSQGLMQVIPPTFAAYHVPGTSFNILDPLANMAAAAAYIRARYGGNVPGSPYANGTPGGTKGWHMVGERGPEWMKFRGGERVKSNQDVRQRMAGLRNRDVDRPITINFNGRTTEEAVRRAETHLVPKLRTCLQQRTGTR